MGNCIKNISGCECLKKDLDSENKIELSEMETNSPKENMKSNIILLVDRLEDITKIVKNLENR